MKKDEELLHPLIRAGLPKARARIKRYKEMGVITLKNGMLSIAKLAEQQAKDFTAWKKKSEREKAVKQIEKRCELIKQING